MPMAAAPLNLGECLADLAVGMREFIGAKLGQGQVAHGVGDAHIVQGRVGSGVLAVRVVSDDTAGSLS